MGKSTLTVYEQSAVVPFRKKGGDLQVLLITSRNNGNWIVPKGLIEAGLSARESAAVEAHEEAGIRGEVSTRAVADYSYSKWGGTCDVAVYLMKVKEVLDDWLEKEEREREWVTLEKAIGRVKRREIRDTLEKLPKHIKRAEFVK
ncbi:MAG: NUDIX hydrolase [Planctomycetota bacterium]|nr:NUDIX hydrolase [Planctomycetota bacterium]